MKKLPLYAKIIIALVLGIIWALISNELGLTTFTRNWIAPLGEIFIRLLKMLAIPLVLLSIISGIANLSDISRLGSLGARTISLYLLTTTFAVSVGLLLVNLIAPGTYLDADKRVENRVSYEQWARQSDVEIIGTPISSSQDGEQGMASEVNDNLKKKLASAEKAKASRPLDFLLDMVPSNIFRGLGNNQGMLQIIFFAIFFGVSIAAIGRTQLKTLVLFIEQTNTVFLKMVDTVMKASPFFVFALIAGVIANMAETTAEILDIFKGLGIYSVAVLLGLLVMIAVVYPLLLKFFVKIQYSAFFQKIAPALFLGFSTSSSAATLPVTMDCVENNLKVNKQVSSFVLPIGATINMDGTALYQAVAAVFLAQLHNIDLSLSQQLTIIFTATLASIGTAAVPSAGVVMLIVIMETVGLNPAWIAIILPVDRILDMSRTVANVTGDMAVCTIVNRFSRKKTRA